MEKVSIKRKTFDNLSELRDSRTIDSDELSTLLGWLMSQLTAWEFAKISQGGHTNSDVPLRRVFIDLPVAEGSMATEDIEERIPFLQHFLRSKPVNLLRAIQRKKQAEARSFRIEDEARTAFERGTNFSASLLIGGPGQGKSTLGQIACQIQRAAWLRPFITQFKAGEQELIRSFETPSKSNSSSASANRKNRAFPLQISLPELSSWLASGQVPDSECPQILLYLASLTSSRQCKIEAHLLARLVSRLPILLVLDGFDEVGATKDRVRLVEAANELLLFIAGGLGLAQVIATTRPQGYMGEFSKLAIELEQFSLVPLDKNEALVYAEKLLFEKIGNLDERAETLKKIKNASDEPATERLLTTPLQVTILAALVHQRGRAPRERWNLFHGYFTYSYARETERNSYAAELLRDFRIHIEQIHARVALLMQVEAERIGGGSSRMPKERLKEVIDAVLSEAGYEGEEKDILILDIAKAAEERLVFLVEPEPGSFGFEIRSFQEFMCAWAITTGPERYIVARLKNIARAPMFRNVLLFAFSRFFSEASHLRDPVVDEVIPGLNVLTNDISASLTLSGSLLALETIEEGAALSYPKWARALMEVACLLLTLPPEKVHRRLARVVTPEIKKVLIDQIESAIATSNFTSINYFSIWVVLVELCARGDESAREIADAYWEKADNLEDVLSVLNNAGGAMNSWLKKRCWESADRLTPNAFLSLRNSRSDANAEYNWVTVLCDAFDRESLRRIVSGQIDLNRLTQNVESLDILAHLPPPPSTWAVWCKVAVFQRSPSSSTLASALEALADSPEIADTLMWRASWPLTIILRASRSPQDYRTFATKCAAGHLGDLAEWRRIEQVLRSGQTTSLESVSQTSFAVGLNAPIAQLISGWWAYRSPDENHANVELKRLNALFSETTIPFVKDWAGRAAIMAYATNAHKTQPKEYGLLEWITAQPDMSSHLMPRPKHMPLDLWQNAMDIAFEHDSFPFHHSLEVLADELLEGIPHPHLLRTAAWSPIADEHQRLPKSKTKQIARNVRENSRYLASIDALILIARLGELTEDEEKSLFDQIFDPGADEIYVSVFVSAVGQSAGHNSKERQANLLAGAFARSKEELTRARIIIELRSIFQHHKSDLSDLETWSSLALPMPAPIAARRTYEDIVQIESIRLRNIRPLRLIEISPTILEDSGQWIVIVGPNGSGKTSILRAICLALRNTDDPSIWPRNSLSFDWSRRGSDGRVFGASAMAIAIQGGAKAEVAVREGSTRAYLRESTSSGPLTPFVFAYGCRRGTSSGGNQRQVDLTDKDGPEIATLFDDTASLIHAETWLISLYSASIDDPYVRRILNAVCLALSKLLDISEVFVREQEVWIVQDGKPTLPLSSMSDGYLTSAGWLIDLIARWVFIAQRHQIEITEDFLGHMTGIAIIDEIDLHLHPAWQVEIIHRTKKLLPRMTFVVSTHNPMTLAGVTADQIWILENEANDIRIKTGKDDPSALTGAGLFQEYFSLRDALPSHFGPKLSEFTFLSRLSNRTNTEEIQVVKLRNELTEHNLLPEWASRRVPE
jgi:energy-coupling factor transporter ATP-binding protein EcfA2